MGNPILFLKLFYLQNIALESEKSIKNRFFRTWIFLQIQLQIHNGNRKGLDFFTASTGPLGEYAEKFLSKSDLLCGIGKGSKSIFTIFQRVCMEFSSFSLRTVLFCKISNTDSNSAWNSESNELIRSSIALLDLEIMWKNWTHTNIIYRNFLTKGVPLDDEKNFLLNFMLFSQNTDKLLIIQLV